MKICMFCGAMISPHPMHKQEKGTCDDCLKDFGISERIDPNPVDNGRPKMRGKHMVVQKSQAQIMMEKRKKELGPRYY
jgi:DNA-directed RNA polymerase subunit M/transcription elongation factor TFIIS